MSFFEFLKKRRADRKQKKKDRRLIIESPSKHRKGDLEYSGAVRNVSGEKKEKKQLFDFTYFVKAMTQVFTALFALCVMLYFGYHAVKEFTTDVKTSPVRSMTETEYRDAVGYIIRSETVISDSPEGIVDYTVDEGERVAKGETVCSVYSSVSTSTRTQIEELDEKIAVLEKSLVSGTVPKGILEVSDDVSEDYASFMIALSSGNIRKALDISDTFCSDLGRMKVLSRDGSGIYERYLELLEQRTNLIASLGSPSGSVRAAKAGYLFYSCDGYESIFTQKLVSEFTESAFNAAINSEPSPQTGKIGKIVDSSVWYLAVPVEGYDMSFLERGSYCNIVFSDNSDTVISMKLEKKVKTETGNLLLFSSDIMPEDFSYLREQNIRLEYQVYDGYRVPVSAVHSYEGMTGVFTLNGGYVYFRKINILTEGEGYYIVSAYEDIEPGMPDTYKTFSYGEKGTIDDYAAMHATCEKLGFARTDHDNGGIRLYFGEKFVYYYYLSNTEFIITSGENLYHGKVLG